MESILVTAPEVQPVTLDEVKEHLRIGIAEVDQDDYLQDLLYSAVDQIEKKTNRKLITQTVDVLVESWRETWQVLPYGQIQSISYIECIDVDGNTQVIPQDCYVLSFSGTDSARIVFNDKLNLPIILIGSQITIRLICGYGEAGSNVPASIRAAIKLLVGDMFDGEDSTLAVDRLLMPYRLWG